MERFVPSLNFPEDAELTRRQLLRAAQAPVQITDKYHPVIYKALREGVIEFDESEISKSYNSFSL